MLVNDHAAQGLDSLRDPNRVLDRKNQFSRFARGFVAYPVIGRIGVRKGVVRRILARKGASDQKQGKKKSVHD